ncbi:hypothetical protein KIH87_17185 [Paraneptunicella aestuarii]|uniref:hypothetical protein n=1 Tax=Paraneptunicella aestuarii TaxID=2831148 RepID=UPI001E29CAB5|nr:hypothetical protein [Paraneptunicella aestuarii]UAA38397.1 hypothetical protein KIH87_17185 [Paraneptunicella aestuarii]
MFRKTRKNEQARQGLFRKSISRLLVGTLTLSLLAACDDDKEIIVYVPVEPTQPQPTIVNYNYYTEDHATAHEINIDYDALSVRESTIAQHFPLEINVTANAIGDDDIEPYAAFYIQLIPADATTFSLAEPQYKVGTFHFDADEHFNEDTGWRSSISQSFRLDLPNTIPTGSYRIVALSAHALISAQHDEKFYNTSGLQAANLGLDNLDQLPTVDIVANDEHAYDHEIHGSHSRDTAVSFDINATEASEELIQVVIEHYLWGDEGAAPEARISLEAFIAGEWQAMELVAEDNDEVLASKFHELLNKKPFSTGTALRKNQGLAGFFNKQQKLALYEQLESSGNIALSVPLRLNISDSDAQEYADADLSNNTELLEPIVVLAIAANAFRDQEETSLSSIEIASAFSEGTHSIFNNSFDKSYSVDTDIISLDLASISEDTTVQYTLGPSNQPSVIFEAQSTVNFEVLGTGNVKAVDATASFQAGLLDTNGWNVNIGGQIPEFDDNGLALDNGQLVLEDYTLFSSTASVDIAFQKDFDWKVSRDLTLAQKSIPIGIVPVSLSAGTNGDITSNLSLSGDSSNLTLNGMPISSDVGAWLNVGINLNPTLVDIDILSVDLILNAGFTVDATLLQSDINIDHVGYTYSNEEWAATGSISSDVNLISAELDATVQVGAAVNLDVWVDTINSTYYIVNEDNVQIASTDGFLLSPVSDSFSF